MGTHDWVRCRGCLGGLGRGPEAGLCDRCWQGLVPLPEERCGRCALSHAGGAPCPEPVAWELGEALWDYHAGRPPLGPLLVPGIKRGEGGWKRALLRRRLGRLPAARADLDEVLALAPGNPEAVELAREWKGRSGKAKGWELAHGPTAEMKGAEAYLDRER